MNPAQVTPWPDIRSVPADLKVPAMTEAAPTAGLRVRRSLEDRDPATVVIQMIALSRNLHQREAFLRRWGSLGAPWVRAFIKPLEGPDPDTLEQRPAPAYLCNYPWRSVVVLWDGRVVPCCRDDDARLVLGDLKRERLRDIWHGVCAKALREAHSSGRFDGPHLCEECAWRRHNFAAAMAERHPSRARDNPLQW